MYLNFLIYFNQNFHLLYVLVFILILFHFLLILLIYFILFLIKIYCIIILMILLILIFRFLLSNLFDNLCFTFCQYFNLNLKYDFIVSTYTTTINYFFLIYLFFLVKFYSLYDKNYFTV